MSSMTKFGRTLVNWTLVIGVMLFAVWFAVANRHTTHVSFDPFSQEAPFWATPQIPVYALVLFSVFIGILIGGFASWFSAGRVRRLARERKRENKKLVREVEAVQKEPQGTVLPVPQTSSK